jgi:hypothetical protein
VEGNIGKKILLSTVLIPLSLALTLVSWVVASKYSIGTPGSFVVDRLVPPVVTPNGWGPGRGLLVQFVIDTAFWFGILGVGCWLVPKLRSRPGDVDRRRKE